MHWVNKCLHNCKYTQSFTGWTNLCFCTLLSRCVLRCVKLNMRYFVSICLCHQPSRFRNVVTYLFLQQYAQFHSVCLIFIVNLDADCPERNIFHPSDNKTLRFQVNIYFYSRFHCRLSFPYIKIVALWTHFYSRNWICGDEKWKNRWW